MDAPVDVAALEPAGADTGDRASASGPIIIDLTPIRPPKKSCAQGEAGEIVVCAQDQEQFRLRPLDPRFARYDGDDKRMRIKLGDNLELEPDTELADVGGFPSKRVMARVKIKF